MRKVMTGSQISRELGISRQAVSQTLKSGMEKLYRNIIKYGIADEPFDAVYAMMCAFGLDNASQEELVDFIYLLPNDIRREVQKDARFKF